MYMQKKKENFEHEGLLLIRSVFSKLNSTDAIAEFLLDEEYLRENLGMASLYLGYKQSVDDSARHYASLLKEKLDAANIPYCEVDNVEEMAAKGIDAVPVLQVDNIMMSFTTAVEWIKNRSESN